MAHATIAYRMQFIKFPKSDLSRITKTIFEKLHKNTGIKVQTKEIWWLDFKLQNLEAINNSRYVSMMINKGLNLTAPEIKFLYRNDIRLNDIYSNNFFKNKGLRWNRYGQIKQFSEFRPQVNEILSSIGLQAVRLKECENVNRINKSGIYDRIDNSKCKYSENRNFHMGEITQSATIWTDGGINSCNLFCSGFLIHANNKEMGATFVTDTFQNSFEAEAQAMDKAIETCKNVQRLVIWLLFLTGGRLQSRTT